MTIHKSLPGMSVALIALLWAAQGGRSSGPSQASASARGHEYYLNSERGADSNPGTQAAPWKTLRNVDKRDFVPGDTIYFARGSVFTGGFTVVSSGTEARPITFTAYETGAAPKFTNPDYAVLNGNAIRVDGSYIVIDGLYFTDCATAPPGNRPPPSGGGSPPTGGSPSHKVGAIFISTNSAHNIVRNCEITRSPMCIHVYGQHNLITRNYVHDLDNLPARGWWGVGIMICNSNNEVSYNKIVNCRQKSESYGFDGGAMELDDRDYPKDNISVHHNWTRDNEGFLEVVEGSVSLKNFLVAYNVVDDWQQFLRLSSTEIENARVENNTVILTHPKDSVVTPSMLDFSWFAVGSGSACGTRPTGTILSYRNNIFYLGNNYKVSPYCDFPHDHNIYWRPRDRAIRGWAMLGANAELGEGDQIVDPKFVSMGEKNFHLQADSPAIRAGVALSYTKDADDKPVPAKTPDIGAYQHQ